MRRGERAEVESVPLGLPLNGSSARPFGPRVCENELDEKREHDGGAAGKVGPEVVIDDEATDAADQANADGNRHHGAETAAQEQGGCAGENEQGGDQEV